MTLPNTCRPLISTLSFSADSSMPCIWMASTLLMVVAVVCEPLGRHGVGLRNDRVVGPLLEQRQPDPAIAPFTLDVQFAGEVLLGLQERIGEGRDAV